MSVVCGWAVGGDAVRRGAALIQEMVLNLETVSELFLENGRNNGELKSTSESKRGSGNGARARDQHRTSTRATNVPVATERLLR